MRILAFDCAGAQCAAAVRVGAEIVAEAHIQSDRGHAQLLMPLLTQVAAEAGVALRDFDRFAVTTGPGSFTGIRVALAAARGLALGTDRPVVGISVFDVVAADAARAGIPAPRLLVAVEARRAECFLQLFDPMGDPMGPPTMLAPEAVGTWLGPGPVAVAGDAARKIVAAVPEAIDMGAALRPVTPGTLARLAAERPLDGLAPKPFYLRAPDVVPAAARATAISKPLLTLVPLTRAMSEVAAALHGTSDLPEHWTARSFADLLSMPGCEGRLAIDRATGDPAGLALWRVGADEAELLTICVPPGRQRRGIGRLLLAEALAVAGKQGARRMVLEVAVDNASAKALYRAFGFERRGLRPGYYRTKSGALDAEILALEAIDSRFDARSIPLPNAVYRPGR